MAVLTVSQAAANYETARQANIAAQAASSKAAADVEAAKANILVVTKAASDSVQAANSQYFAALSTQQTVIETAHNAQIAQSNADIALKQVVLDSQQGPPEVIPPNQQGANLLAR
jgi:hypothetical protein